ncbi:hypothetical protein B1H18_17040 [Streptomyces tsukubensis]|uniref:Uncharacterized protein n=1 Tax=Streptomyces tsukubensis TaxID=83656 RepID=A0A1V4A8U5_9ACTN|nr:hypothetical protein B1H18_17040 [Streptomyces tsukubensis]
MLVLFGWIFGWYLSFWLFTDPQQWILWALAPYYLASIYGIYVQLKANLPAAVRIRRTLRAHPWQILADVPRGLAKHPDALDDGVWFALEDPGRPGERVPLVFVDHARTYWWIRRIGGPRTKAELKAQIEPLWFAGDPRTVAVVAATGRGGRGPKRLHFLYQRGAVDRRGIPHQGGRVRSHGTG